MGSPAFQRPIVEKNSMAEEELEFEGDDMQVDEGSVLRARSLVNTELFEDVDTTINAEKRYVRHVCQFV